MGSSQVPDCPATLSFGTFLQSIISFDGLRGFDCFMMFFQIMVFVCL